MARGYRAWALFSAPVAAWCVIELALRIAAGETAGIAGAALLGACAAASGWLALWRARAIAVTP
jgi:hypothetical protein